ncbi:hypothetical protein [Synechococcus sp. WH 8016]|nr:hypothetical protein [Synechococcus sp. WH 8016]
MLSSPLYEAKDKPKQQENESANHHPSVGVDYVQVLNDSFLHCLIV